MEKRRGETFLLGFHLFAYAPFALVFPSELRALKPGIEYLLSFPG